MSRRSWLPGSPAGSASSASSASPDSPDSPVSPLLSGHGIGYFSPPPLLDIGTTQEVEHAIFQGLKELEIVKDDLIDNNDNVNHILKELKKNQGIIYVFRGVSDDEQNRIILSFLDELNCYRQGCARVQLTPLTVEFGNLETILNPPTAIEDVPVTRFEKMKKTANDFVESATKLVSPQSRNQVARSEALKIKLNVLKSERLKLMNNSFLKRYSDYRSRVLTAIESLNIRNPNVESFCGEAIFLDGVGVEGADKSERHVRFQLNIVRMRNGNQELILGRLPNPDTDGTNDMITAADEMNIMNALFLYLLNGQKEDNTVKIDKLEPLPRNNKACGCCSILGGAKKIKRTRQSKKKKARRSKLKSKRVRRKNKSRSR